MKILHIITSLQIGGAEKLMVDLLPKLRNLGNEVELLLFDGTHTPFYDELECVGIKIHNISIGGNVYNPLNIFRLIKYIKRFDIIHTHNTACQYYVPLAKILSNAKCKLITTEHSTNNRRRDIKFFKYLDKFVYHKYSCIISISEKTSTSLKNFIGRGNNIITIENGIDLTKYNKLPSISLASSNKVITMIAGFRAAKDQDTLIKAISLLPNEYNLWLVGNGERREILINLATKLKISERVNFLGIRNDIPQILEQSHIVVLSSHWEGFGLSIVEGMSSKRPVLASDVDGLREIVKGYGILFPHQDYKALANEIKAICENKDKYNQVAIACKKRAMQFDINITAIKYNKVYGNYK